MNHPLSQQDDSAFEQTLISQSQNSSQQPLEAENTHKNQEGESTKRDTEDSKSEETMTTSNYDDLPTFEPGRDQAAIANRWSKWLEIWSLYLASRELDFIDSSTPGADYQKSKTLKPLFLLKIGDDAREVYNSKKKSDGTDKLTEVIKFMSEHYAPRRSKFAYVSIFCRARRHEGESVNDYMVRLRKLAKPCEFGDQLDKELLRAFVFGCGIERVEEMMCTDDKKTLDDAIECGLRNEHKLEDLRQIRVAHTQEPIPDGSAINHTTFRKPEVAVKQVENCAWCGNKPHDRINCPARDKECSNCNKIGHFARVCRSGQTQKGMTSDQRNGSSARGNHATSRGDGKPRSNHTGIRNQQTSNRANPSTNKQASGARGVNALKGSQSPTNSNVNVTLSAAEYNEYLRAKNYLEASEWGDQQAAVISMDSADTNAHTTVMVDDCKVRVLVDTGAAVNVLDEPTYNQLGRKRELAKLEKPYYGFGSPDKPLEVLGFFVATVSWRGDTGRTPFIVVKGRHQNLLCKRTAVAFKMVSLHLEDNANKTISINQVEEKENLTKQELAAMFPELFNGKLGCVKGIEIKLEIDETVKPVKQPLRATPFHYRAAVEKELDKQEADDIIEKVNSTTTPIKWISNLVVVPKDRQPNANGKISKPRKPNMEQQHELAVRLTCDSRQLNKAVKRVRFAMRTIDDLVVIVNGATVFSKLDLAKLEGRKPDIALNEFLAAFHNTPHSATGVAPNQLMFGRTSTSGLPIQDQDKSIQDQSKYHQRAREHHEKYVEQMKTQYDHVMKTKECPIRLGDKVLFKRTVTRKDMSPWDPDPFTVIAVKGSLMTVSRRYPKLQCITRNSSCFRLYRGLDVTESRESREAESETQSESEIEDYATQDVQVQAENADPVILDQKVKRKPGRPTKEAAEEIAKEREAEIAAKMVANPPSRSSSRLKKIDSQQNALFRERGKILCRASTVTINV